MYWIWETKPERDFCCEISDEYKGGWQQATVIGPQLMSGKPLTIPFPGYVTKKLDDQYHKGPPRPPGDYLICGGHNIISARLRDLLEEQKVEAEYYPVEVKAKHFETDQEYFYLRVIPYISCIDRENSEFTEFTEDMGGGIDELNKLVINESVIPPNTPLLRMYELPIILVQDRLKMAIENRDISCVHFISPEDYPRSHIIYGDLVRETTGKS